MAFSFYQEGQTLSKAESATVIKGTTEEVYLFVLKANKPVGIREIQRSLNLSSPSVARYHISKLVDAGLLKQENGSYVVDKILLKHTVKINRFLIPRHLFYAFFAITALIIELSFLRPTTVTSIYFFAVMITATFALIHCYETVKTWTSDCP